jgi:aminoglycoside phosphotransferase (APT) family kinase protein
MTANQQANAPRAAGDRIGWAEVPSSVRDWVERTLGGHVLDAATQHNGFSPGAACRLLLRDGRRAFMKAVSGDVNEESARLHRTEAGIMRAMPPDIPVPSLLGSYDDGQWVALLLTDVSGRLPAQPWQRSELVQVIDALDRLHERLAPAPVGGAPKIVDLYRDVFRGWRRMAGGATAPPDDEMFRTRLDQLAELEGEWPAAADGATLLHGDLRADNMLITEHGVILVDWPRAAVGAPWFDLVGFAPSAVMHGAGDPEWLLAQSRHTVGVPADAVTSVVTAVAGYFTEQATRPAPPGLPTLRAFQAAQGDAARAWLAARLGWR